LCENTLLHVILAAVIRALFAGGSDETALQQKRRYSITSSASNCIDLKTARPRALAVFILITNCRRLPAAGHGAALEG
jgi:hypothetical protein